MVTSDLTLVYGQSADSKISPRLDNKEFASDVIVQLKGHRPFDVSGLPREKGAKGWYVYESLARHSARTQRKVNALLDEAGIDGKHFCVSNVIWITDRISRDLLLRIAALEDVLFISPNEVVSSHRLRPSSGPGRSAGPEWGILRIGADSVWRMGYTGQGVVVGGQDTGYEWDHPALSKAYRGNNGGEIDHNYNWFDAIHELSPLHEDSITNPELTPCGVDALTPCDDNGHGTHTMGTIVGLDGENEIGIAPDAQWVGVRCMDRGYGSPMTYLEAFEWFLAPTDVNGDNPDPSKAPHVINNSWRCPEMEGCNPENFGLLDEAIRNLKAAGVVVVVSAGNDGGAGCGSVNAPPAIFEASFAVGAIRQNDTIAGFSSRGPVMVDSSGRIKPDVTAPGAGVRSAWLDSAYIHLSGTSMAGPHVAGTVALMISANPALAGQVEEIERILRETARPQQPIYDCDSDSLEMPNNTYGYGIIDALAAVEMALTVTSTIDVENVPGGITLFPNPSPGRVNYVVDTPVDRLDFKVYDMSGRQVAGFTRQVRSGTLDLEGFNPGIYAVVAVDALRGEVRTSKVVIGGRTP